MKHNHPFAFFTVTNRLLGCVLSQVNIPYCSKGFFSCSSLSVKLCNGASIHEYKAYWHMNFLLMWHLRK